MCGTHASDFCFSDDLCCIAFNRSYTYDALGNLIYRQLPNGENQYHKYDLENQLVHTEIKKAANKPTTSTAIKSAYRKRWPIKTATSCSSATIPAGGVWKRMAGLSECTSALLPAKLVCRPWNGAALQLFQVLRTWCGSVCESGSDWVVGWE